MPRKKNKQIRSMLAAALVISSITPVAVSANESNQFSHIVFTIDGKQYAVPYDVYNAAVGLGLIDPLKFTHVTINGKIFTRAIFNAAVSLGGSAEAARTFLASNTTHIAPITTILTTIDQNGLVIPQEPIPDYTPGPPPDTTPPNFTKASIHVDLSKNVVLTVEFNERLQSATATEPANYEVNGQALPASATVTTDHNGQVVTITIPDSDVQTIFGFDPSRLSADQLQTQILTAKQKVSVTNVKDAVGNVLKVSQEQELSGYMPAIVTYPAVVGMFDTVLSTSAPTITGQINTPTYDLKAGETLPAGLKLDKSTGELTGTPTAITPSEAAQTVTIEVTYQDPSGNARKTEATVSITISKKLLTITTPTIASKVYDGTTTATATAGDLIGVAAGDTVTVAATAEYTDKNAGTGKEMTVTYTLSGADAGKYAAPAPIVVNTGEITPKSLKSQHVIIRYAKVYDGTTTTSVTLNSFTGKVGNDDVTVSATGTFDNPNVGSNKAIHITYTLSGADAGNYVFAGSIYKDNSNRISPMELTITPPTAVNKVYDGTAAASVTAGTLNGKVGSDDVTVSATGTFDDVNVGTGKTVNVTYTLGGAQAGNYTLAQGTTTATITPKVITATATDITAATGSTTITLNEAITGLAASDIVVKKNGASLEPADYTVAITGNSMTITFKSSAALANGQTITVEITKANYSINNGSAVTVNNNIPQ